MSIEAPPPHNPQNPQQWAEELVDYLLRTLATLDTRITSLETKVSDHEARITALENP